MGARARRGFTLVELLVVMAVVAILAGLLFAAVGGVRERGEAAQCLSNLRQLAAANLAYAAENGGRYVFAQDSTNTVRWHGVRSSGGEAFDPQSGPLARYLGGEGRVKECPSLRATLGESESAFNETGAGGYGYNAVYIGGTPADPFGAERLANVPQPACTMMFADAALPTGKGLQEYPFAEPVQWVDYAGRLRGNLAPSVHFRHQERANVVWCDGHATSEAPSRLGVKNRYGGDATRWKVGWFGPLDENGYWNPLRSGAADRAAAR